MTDNDIIKALECCVSGDYTKSQVEVCRPCYYFHDGNCTDLLKRNALDLINRQKAKTKEFEAMLRHQAEIIDILNLACEEKNKEIDKAKAEAVREFADMLSQKVITKKAETSDYWINNVKSYRAMQGYADIEHETDNFLRGYNEAVEDVISIMEEMYGKENET